jgi:hypothetical protein
LDACASSTSRTTRASIVSAPIAVALIASTPSVSIVPARTEPPGATSTGRLSPVSAEASTAALPSVTTPSTGMRSPGRTTTTSPTRRAAIGRSNSVPARRMRAVVGCRRISARKAEAVPPLARPSSHLPSSTKTMTRTELSKYKAGASARNSVQTDSP